MNEITKSKCIETYIVPLMEQRVRLSDFKSGTFKSLQTRKSFKNAIKKGLVYVNGNAGNTGDFIMGGEKLEIFQISILRESTKKSTIELKVEVIYEDDYLAIVNKPPGITVSGNKRWTLENALQFNLTKSSIEDALKKPEPIHRLDHPTSGCLLIGKTTSAVIKLNKLFEERKISKRYIAITIGKMKEQGIVQLPVEEKNAKTSFRVVNSVESERFEYLNLVRLEIETGRRHQIRKHMADIGNPILGDKDYGIEGKILMGKGLYLHSEKLQFIHPFTEQLMDLSAKTPKKFLKIFPQCQTN